MGKWTHNSLQHDLVDYLRGTRNLIAWEDMQLGPHGSARPDVYTMPRSFAKFRPLAYEIKVSKADFRSDVTSGKWQQYLDYACGVIFAVPSGLVSKADIPPGSGLIVRHENVWRMAKGPTLKPLDDLPVKAWIKLIIDGVEREANRLRNPKSRFPDKHFMDQEETCKRFGKEAAALISEALRSRESVEWAIEQDRLRRKQIKEASDSFAKRHREEAARQTMMLNEEYLKLAESLGLSSDASVQDLIFTMAEARRRLDENTEIERLMRYFKSVQASAEKALEPMPGDERK